MDATNQQKILNAGFTIIRDEVMHKGGNKYEGKIKAKTKERQEWFTLEKGFTSIKSLTDRIKELLNDAMTVKD